MMTNTCMLLSVVTCVVIAHLCVLVNTCDAEDILGMVFCLCNVACMTADIIVIEKDCWVTNTSFAITPCDIVISLITNVRCFLCGQ